MNRGLVFVLLCWTGGFALGQPDPWRAYSEERSRVKTHLNLSTTPPDVVRLFSNASVGESFFWTAWTVNSSRESRFYVCSDVAYLGVQAGSVILRLRRYNVSLARGDPEHDRLLSKLSELEEAATWHTYGEQATLACSFGRPSLDTSSTVYVPLKYNLAITMLPETHNKGIVTLSYDDIDSSMDASFESVEAVMARPIKRPTKRKGKP